MLRFRFLAALQVAAVILFGPSAVASDPRVDEAIAGWKSYTDAASRVCGRILISGDMTYQGKTKATPAIEYNIKQGLAGRSLSTKTGGTETEEEVFSTNRKYSFGIKRNIGRTDWYADRLDVDRKKPFKGMSLPLEQELALLALGPVSSGYLPLAELVRASSYKTVSTASEADGCLRIEFTNPHPVKSPHERFVPQGGWFVVDPKRSFVVRRAEWRCDFAGTPMTIATTMTYADGDGPVPLPRRFESVRSQGGVIDKSVAEFDLRLDDTPDESEFSLSHYGLPEPKGHEIAGSRGYYVWLACAAAVAFAAALVLRRLSNRVEAGRRPARA